MYPDLAPRWHRTPVTNGANRRRHPSYFLQTKDVINKTQTSLLDHTRVVEAVPVGCVTVFAQLRS